MSSGVELLIQQDLSKSDLTPEDLNVRPLNNAERAVTNSPAGLDGYVIPYFSIYGKPIPFYRVRLFEHEPKYKQPQENPNHIFFPKRLSLLPPAPYIVITEGEKKAAVLVKHGIPCVALSGVDSWRNRIVRLPKDVALSAAPGNRGGVQAKLKPQENVTEEYDSPVAIGFQELLDHILKEQLTVIICFDSDSQQGVKPEVQRAAAMLAYELRFRGIAFNRIRQLTLPCVNDDKTGLDDFVMARPIDELTVLIQETLEKRSAFPRHPSIRAYINKRLQNPKLSRKETQNISLAVLSDLDANGIRLRSESDITYYFDNQTKALLKSAFATNSREGQFEAPFTQFLYRNFGLSGVDTRLLTWLGTQFTSEDPIDKVSPYNVFARTDELDDTVNYQVSDSQYATVSADGLQIFDNGTKNILFESDHVEPLDVPLLRQHYDRLLTSPVKCWWGDTLSSVRLRDKDRTRIAHALLYYMSPWLHRWRGMQLPIEMIIGESGSGKSTLMELRLSVIDGRPFLRNSPQDLKDWHASVTNVGGLHVTDNVQLTDKNLRQRLSDEICRIVTEPNPTIEQRKYYTNADLIRIPVRCVFAITAIQQPFQNADLLQRSMILELDKTQDGGGSVMFDSEWKSQQLKRVGGREAWVAHHLVVLTKFFQLVRAKWRPNYQARHRLIHFEQAMQLMAEVFNFPAQWLPNYLTGMTDKVVADNDWVLEGLRSFSDSLVNGKAGDKVFVQQISEWATLQDDFEKCEMLTNVRRLGRYMKVHKGLILSLTGLGEAGSQGNRMTYKLQQRPPKSF